MKTDATQLAILTGVPAFEKRKHVGRPNLGDRDRLFERINDLLDRRWLTNSGFYAEEFERQVASRIGVKHCIAVCNGTAGLQVAIRAAGLNGEVIVPSMTFIATAHALQWQRITPVFCDIDPATHNLDVGRIEELVTPRTSGIIGVHLWGRPCPVEALEEVARRQNLRLLYDSAQAFGVSHQGKMLGCFGDAEVFSFHATKFVNALEGGAVVTNDDDLAHRIRLMKDLGFAGPDRVDCVGINARMHDVSAAMGVTMLESFEEIIAINQSHYRHYRRELSDIPGVSLVEYDESESCNYQFIVVEVEEDVTGLSRDQLVTVLQAENVLARRYFFPGCHNLEPYRSLFPKAGLVLPETERLVKRVICLPTGSDVQASEIEAICQLIRLTIENSTQVAEWLHLRQNQQ